MNQIQGKLQKLLFDPCTIIAIGIALLVIASLTGVPMGNDEGVWGYIGRIWTDHGLLPYTGAIENKATGIYMIFALSHKLFGINIWFPRVLALIASIGTTILIYRLAKKFFSARAGIFAMAIFLFAVSLPSVDGPYAETETFMNLFRIGAFILTALAFEKERYRAITLIGSGVSWAFAIAFKQLAIVDGLPLLVFHVVLLRAHWKQAARSFGFVVIGLVGGTLLSLVPYLIAGGTIPNYLDGAWRILLQSGSSPAGAVSRISGFFRHFFNVRLSPLLITLIFFLFTQKQFRDKPWRLPLIVWALTDFFAYTADGWYLDHHFKVFIPSWSIVFGIMADWTLSHLVWRHEPESTTATVHPPLVAMLALMIFYLPFEPHYYQNIRKAIIGNVHDQSARDLGLYLRANSAETDTVYVWGFHMGPAYYYSDRLAPSRYFSEPFLGRPGALSELQNDLKEKSPRLIAVPLEKYPLPEWLTSYITAGYEKKEIRFNHDIYIRNSK